MRVRCFIICKWKTIQRQTGWHRFTGCHLCLTSNQQSTNKQCVVGDVSRLMNESLLDRNSVINRGRVLTDWTSRKHCCWFNCSAVLGAAGVYISEVGLWKNSNSMCGLSVWFIIGMMCMKSCHVKDVTVHFLHLVEIIVQLWTSTTSADELNVSIFQMSSLYEMKIQFKIP